MPLLLLLATAPSIAEKPASPSAAVSEVLQDLKLTHQLTLVDPGAEPRRVVAYAPKPGTSTTYEVVTRQTMNLSMTAPDGSVMDLPFGDLMPTMILKSRNTVGQPVANGLVPVRIEQLGMRFDAPNADPAMAAAMKESADKLSGTTFELFVDPKGKLVQLDVVGGQDPELAAMMQTVADQLMDRIPTFPDQPIGRGAKWTVDIDMAMQGLDLVVTQTNTVTELTPDAVVMDVQLAMRVGDGGLQFPGMPPGAKVEVQRFDGKGTGTMRVDLGTLVSTGTVGMDLDVKMSMNVPPNGPMTMGMRVQQTSETRLAP